MFEIAFSDSMKILENSHDGILYTDAEGIILYCNPAYVEITKIDILSSVKDRNEIIGHNISEYTVIGPYSCSAAIEAAASKKTVITHHFYKDTASFMAVAKPIIDADGNVEAVVTNIKEASEITVLKKQLENAEKVMENYSKLFKYDSYEADTGIIAVSDKMQEIFRKAARIKDVDVTVMIRGESGVGKEVVAQYIHKNSRRRDNQLITINCGAVSEQLLETELFGYTEGTFTGGLKKGKTGLIEAADGGTLFLDEIGDISLNMQVKLLRVLENRTITRVGSTTAIPVDVRIIAATNKDLEQMVSDGRFREDLYYRLNVVTFNIPSLAERRDDIIPLSFYFLSWFNSLYSMNKKLSPAVLMELKNRKWKGNVRELKNMIERLVVMSENEELMLSDLKYIDDGFDKGSENIYNGYQAVSVNKIIPLSEAVSETEKQLLQKTAKQYGTTRKMAEVLKKDHSTIIRKMQKYGIKPL